MPNRLRLRLRLLSRHEWTSRLSALARSSALRRCQAFCLKTDARAWRGLKAVTVQTPEHKLCSGAMGRSGALGIIQRLGEGVESFMIPCSSAFDEPLSEQIEDAMRELYAKNGEPITSRSSIHTGSGSKNKQDKGFLVICRDLFCEKLFGKKDPFARASVWYVVCRSTRSDSL